MGEMLQSASGRARVAVARDTRESGKSQQAALTSGLQAAGLVVMDLGVLPTPALSWHLDQSEDLAGGVMVTASHNPWQDNGLKLFASDGSKVSDALELACENRYLELSQSSSASAQGNTSATDIICQHDQVQEAYLASLAAPGELSGRSIVLDSASGAGWDTLPRAFRAAGAEVIDISPAPDGRNINLERGATQPHALAAAVIEQGAWAGVALDGDGDRIVLVDEEGSIHDGDAILGVLAQSMRRAGTFRGDAVIGTVTTNGGLEEFLQDLNLGLVRTKVGDRNVSARMSRDGCNLGGESSGHILTPDLCPTGDGTRVALCLLGDASRQDLPLSTLLGAVPRYPVANRQVAAGTRPPLEDLAELQRVASEVQAQLSNRKGCVLLRYSGTEPILRIRVEGPDGDLVQRCADQLAASAASALEH